MKYIKTVLLTIFVISTLGLFSCTNSTTEKPSVNSSVSNLIDDYRKQDGFMTLNIPPSLIGFLIKGDDAKDLKNVVSDIDNLEILICSKVKKDSERMKSFTKELDHVLAQKDYEDLFMINDSGEEVSVKFREEGNKVKELILIIKGKESHVLLNITGSIDKAQVRKLSKSIQVNGDINVDFD